LLVSLDTTHFEELREAVKRAVKAQ
jgi:hypothetical protein